MNKPHPSNEVLAEKIDAHKELIETKLDTIVSCIHRIDQNLVEINGQVKRNSTFRIRGSLLGGIALLIVPTIVTLLLNKLL